MKQQKRPKPEKPAKDAMVVKQGQTPEHINSLLQHFTTGILERAMQGEMNQHLGYARHDPVGNNTGNIATVLPARK